jgi:phosphatidylinositol alpha-1,6-mannosyltransferase
MDASEQYKGHDVVLRALSSVIGNVANLTYVIVGGGDDRPRLELLARELGVANHVVFTGEIDDSELAALYQRSELFVLPARTVVGSPNPKGEGFGIVFLEAMAFGKPVVGPRYGAPAEIIRDGQNGFLIDPEDPASVAEALSRLLADPDVAIAMGKAGRNYVRANYSYGAFREKLREALAI